jgi:hypothetical protein
MMYALCINEDRSLSRPFLVVRVATSLLSFIDNMHTAVPGSDNTRIFLNCAWALISTRACHRIELTCQVLRHTHM